MPWDFPGGSVFKNFPSNAGDTGSTPGPGTKIPHDTGQQSPCVTTRGKPISFKEISVCHHQDLIQPKKQNFLKNNC